MTNEKPPKLTPHDTPVGTVPLISVEGTARECGRQYARIVLERYPGFRQYLDAAWRFAADLSAVEARLIERRAPHLLDLYEGLRTEAGPPEAPADRPPGGGCTSFALSGAVTAGGMPIAGQTKDTPLSRLQRYITLRMRIKDAPTILVLAYPGEILGYGLWSRGSGGMCLFRNDLWSTAGAAEGLGMTVFGLLALASESVGDVVELANQYGVAGRANMLIAAAAGDSVCVETNAGGLEIVRGQDGILTHANHPLGERTRTHERYDFPSMKPDSEYRTFGFRKLLAGRRGRLTVENVLELIADHTTYPLGTCKHASENGEYTTAVVVAEPARGALHVVRGQPCRNEPVTCTV